MLLKCTFLLCTLFHFTSQKETEKVKNKARLPQIPWQMYENENIGRNSLKGINKGSKHKTKVPANEKMLNDDDLCNEILNMKVHYKKRKYNMKVQRKRKAVTTQNVTKKTASISRRKEIAVAKYVNEKKKPHKLQSVIVMPNQNDRLMNKNKLEKVISIGTTDIKRKSMSKAKEYNKFYKPNIIEKKEREKKEKKKNPISSQVQRKPKTVYLKNKSNVSTLIKEDLEKQVLKEESHKIPTIVDIVKEENIWDQMSGDGLLPVMGVNAESLANPSKESRVAPKVHEDDITSIADELAKKVRVLCWVLTHPDNHDTKCKAIKDTWGKRCNKLLFMSTEYDPNIPTVKLDVQEGRGYLWPKVKAAFKYVYDNYHDQYDWYVRADDDTYIVVENLRYLLADFNPKEPMYFGCRFKHFAPQGYMSGGASIPISTAALNRLIPAFENDSNICKVNIGWDLENDDVNLGVCLSRVGVKSMDSRDVAHKGRFLVFMPQDHVSPTKITHDKSYWYWKYVYYPTETGVGCCSDYAISFHYVSPDDMYALDYLIYRIRPYGVQYGEGPVPNVLKDYYLRHTTTSYVKKVAHRKDVRTTVKGTGGVDLYEDLNANESAGDERTSAVRSTIVTEKNWLTTDAVLSKIVRHGVYELPRVAHTTSSEVSGTKATAETAVSTVKSVKVKTAKVTRLEDLEENSLNYI